MTAWLQATRSYSNPASINHQIAYLREQMAQNLGYMDFADQVQVAMLGNTLIVGGYLNTDLIKAKSIFTEHLAAGAITAEKINVDDLSAIAGKFTDLMAGTAGGARLELGENVGEPFLKAYDDKGNIRVRLLQDRLEFHQDGKMAGEMYGATYSLPGIPAVAFERFIISSPRDLHLRGGNMEPAEYSYSNIRAEELQLSLTHLAEGEPVASITLRAGTAAQGGGVHVDGQAFTYSDHPTTTSAANCRIDTKGRFFRSTSASKYKTNIESIEEDRAEAFFEKCQPSWYRSLCEGDRKDWSWYGYVADEVAKVEPRLVDFNKDGEPEGFAYDHVAPLLHVVIRNNRKKIEKIEERLDVIEKQLATNKK